MRNLDVACGDCDAAYDGGADRDSNLHKVLEGAAYSLAMSPDAAWDNRVDALIEKFASVQESDGFLVSYISSQKPDERYKDMHRSHELYCMGHMIEAAVEHFQATGKRNYLEIALRAADHLEATFGPDKLHTTSGHQQIELALVKLFHVTADPQHFNLARYFVDMRGERQRVHREYSGLHIDEGDRRPGRNRPPQYRQDHEPAIEQRYAIGHAVRAGYLYAAMTDMAMHIPSDGYAQAVEAVWDDIVSHKLYITGGVGTHQYRDEGFGDPYVLPNDTGYCETCGGIALLLFSHRMSLMTGDAKYADLIEIILYNHTLACPDRQGTSFFYRNPLQSEGNHKRHPWTDPACCSTNIVRTIPQITRLIYATSEDAIDVNQYVSSHANLRVAAGQVTLKQTTNYPWDGDVQINVEVEQTTAFKLRIRIPGWSRGEPVASDLYRGEVPGYVSVTVNGEGCDLGELEQGYCVLDRTWQDGDEVSLSLPMGVQRVRAHAEVEACRDRVALMSGPLVYCFEAADNADAQVWQCRSDMTFSREHQADLLGGVTVLKSDTGLLTAVPYYVWNNREPGRMQVWMDV